MAFRKSLELERSLGDVERIGKRLYNIGTIFFLQAAILKKSLVYYTQALGIFEKL